MCITDEWNNGNKKGIAKKRVEATVSLPQNGFSRLNGCNYLLILITLFLPRGRRLNVLFRYRRMIIPLSRSNCVVNVLPWSRIKTSAGSLHANKTPDLEIRISRKYYWSINLPNERNLNLELLLFIFLFSEW